MLKRMWNAVDAAAAAVDFVGARLGFGILVGAAVGWLLWKASGAATVGYAAGIAVGLLVFVGALIAGIASRLARRRNRSDSDDQPVA